MSQPQAVAGRGGRVKINGTPVTTVSLITQWTGTITEELYDQTALGDDWTSDVPGFRKMVGRLSGSWDVTSDAGQTTLHNAILGRLQVGLNLFTDEANGHGYELTAYIADFVTTVPVNGLVSFECGFQNFGQVFFE
jgi:hypothetical protein